VKNWSAIAIATLGLSLLTLGGIAACKQGEGERCEFEADCEEGLICNLGKDPHVCEDEASGQALACKEKKDCPDGYDCRPEVSGCLELLCCFAVPPPDAPEAPPDAPDAM
jgi:hypothetical protein